MAKLTVQEIKDNPLGFGFFAVLILVIALACLKPYIGFTQPGHFYERNEYTTKLDVLVFPDRNNTKNYLLPASITKDDNGYNVTRFDSPDGGYEEFDTGNCLITLTDKSLCSTSDADGNDVDYYIQLTKQAPAR
jgi:hypothetical protein